MLMSSVAAWTHFDARDMSEAEFVHYHLPRLMQSRGWQHVTIINAKLTRPTLIAILTHLLQLPSVVFLDLQGNLPDAELLTIVRHYSERLPRHFFLQSAWVAQELQRQITAFQEEYLAMRHAMSIERAARDPFEPAADVAALALLAMPTFPPSTTLMHTIVDFVADAPADAPPVAHPPYIMCLLWNTHYPSRPLRRRLADALIQQLSAVTRAHRSRFIVTRTARPLLMEVRILGPGAAAIGEYIAQRVALASRDPLGGMLQTATTMAGPLHTHIAGTYPRVLCLDGGGVRGLATLRMLKHLEDVLRAEYPNAVLLDVFDEIVGTSTGGIIAAALARGMTVDAVCTMYRTMSQHIFRRRMRVVHLWNALWSEGCWYAASDLETKLRECALDEARFAHIPDLDKFGSLSRPNKRVFLTTTNVEQTKPVLLCSEDDPDVPLVTALRMTSAAPTYFPAMAYAAPLADAAAAPAAEHGEHVGPQTRHYIDGAVGNNCPAALYVQRAWFGEPPTDRSVAKGLVLSVGTGDMPNTAPARRTGILSMLLMLGEMVTDTQERWAHARLQIEAQNWPTRAVRVAPQLQRNIGLDDISPGALDDLWGATWPEDADVPRPHTIMDLVMGDPL